MMEFATYLFAAAAGALVASIWEGSLLVLAVAATLRLFPGIPAKARSLVWLAVMLLVVGLPLLHATHPAAASTTTPVHAGFGWTIALAIIWLSLSIIRAGRLLASALLLQGIARRAQPLTASSEITSLLEGRAILCATDEVSVPSVAGFFAPRILLPGGLVDTLSDSDLRQIVLHEREHLRRGDDWINLLQKLSLVLFPLNPALLWVEKKLCAEREMACDDAVLHATGSPRAYASCLASLAEHTLVRRGVSLALGAWERRPELARRIARILARPRSEMKRSRAVVAAMLIGVVAGGGALSHTPELIQFAGVAPTQTASLPPITPAIPHAVLTSATIPAPRADGLTGDGIVPTPKPHKRAAAPRRTVPSMDDSEQTPLRTDVRMTSTFAPRRVLLAYDEDAQISYAAVPVRNGWLIFQL